MSLWQLNEDSKHLSRTSQTIRWLNNKLPGSKVVTLATDEDLMEPILGLQVAGLTFDLDYLNVEGEDLWLGWGDGTKGGRGSKHCDNLSHLLNTVKKAVADHSGKPVPAKQGVKSGTSNLEGV
jgi:hypothetical protein